MRKLMWFTIGFAVASGLGVWILPANRIVISILIGAILTLLGWKFGVKRLAWAMLGCTVGLSWYLGFMKLYLLPAYSMDGVTTHITVTATEYSYETDYGVGVDGEFELEGKTRKIRI